MENTVKYILKLLTGDIFNENFIAKNLKMMILVAALIVLFTSNRYACIKKIRKIETLKIELESLKHENMILETEITSHSRITRIEELLEKRGIKLEPAKTTVFKIKK
ncbi:MAG: hypothetical protein LBF79_03230 [Dysgonamonadaceae bacterium]|jgi:cell division protein FtsL|nr:hypothetical protein [Dysgonamonadaceae bacterium]